MIGKIAAGAAKAAKGVKARAAKVGDKFYNARRRYTRAAERNLKKAVAAEGATAERYRFLAKQDLQNALSTYDPKTTQKFSKSISNLASELGVDLDKERRRLGAMKSESARRYRDIAEQKSTQRLESAMGSDEARRQMAAQKVFSSEVGHRIIGGMVDVWRDEAVVNGVVDKRKMMESLFDYFKVDNLADLLEEVEKSIGGTLYETGDKEEIYETVKLVLQNKVADNTLVA